MRTIETTVLVDAERRAVVHLPADVLPGAYRAVVVMEEASAVEGQPRLPLQLPVHDVGPWPEGLSLRREDMYGDDGR